MENDVVITFKRMSNDAVLPRFAYPEDACFDLFSPVDRTVPKGGSVIIDLEIASEIPAGYEVCLRPRSGLGIKHGIMLHPGTIDPGYRGNWLVRLFNLGNEDYHISRGDRIVQGALRPFPTIRIVEAGDLSEGRRGKNGLGSTGR
ncbi:MAG TPA: dUTP diphosphatase [Atribacteraceae bacterium]|nr:dUTP diphosphatase [Atribacteraceae bacterium]